MVDLALVPVGGHPRTVRELLTTFHLLLVAGIGWLLGLNRLRMYVAANISNPLFAPALIFAEIQLGAGFRF